MARYSKRKIGKWWIVYKNGVIKGASKTKIGADRMITQEKNRRVIRKR